MERNYYIEYQGNSVELPLGETVVGRDVGCRMRFNDPAVSRRHLLFVRRQDEVFVEDLKSSNGTKLNGRRLTTPTPLVDGDQLEVGSRTLVIRIDDSEAVSSSTLLLRESAFRESLVSRVAAGRPTGPMPAVQLPIVSKQRCPQCGASVSEIDDACPDCGYEWGGFRATSRTDVRDSVSRRRHDRMPVELPIVYVSSELEIEASTRDLSPSGVFVCTQVLDPVGTRCKLTILVDGGPAVVVSGIVRRVVQHDDSKGDEIGLGVEFTHVGEREKAWLDAVIAKLEPESTTYDD